MTATSPTGRRRSRRRAAGRKDRLIQTRVAGDLERTLKEEAAKRRLTVSHLIRNTLEDAFELVEHVTSDVEQIVSGSVELAAAVSRDARKLATSIRRTTESADDVDDAVEDPVEDAENDSDAQHSAGADTAGDDGTQAAATPVTPDSLAHVYGWTELVLNRDATCSRCDAEMIKGDDALAGLSDDPTKPRAWLCVDCAERL